MAWIALLAAIAVCAWFFIERCLYELAGAVASDSLLFLTVGRGIVNGLMPWRDLFETKPPGIFLLSAASLWLTGTQMLAKIAEIFALLGIVLLAVAAALPAIFTAPLKDRRWYLCLSILFGLLLSLYVGDQAGMMLPESYGACLALGYVALLAHDPVLRSWKSIALAALSMLLAAGFKEPFIVSIFAVALILSAPSALPRSFVLPAVIAGVLGLLGLLLLGYLAAFFMMYMPHMFGYHIVQSTVPLPLRAFASAPWLFGNIWSFCPLFACATSLLWCADPVLRWSSDRSRGIRAMLPGLARWSLALYLVWFAIGIGGDFYGHHAMFAAPLTGAFFVAFLSRCLVSTEKLHRIALTVVTIILIATGILQVMNSRLYLNRTGWREEEKEMRTVAEAIDTVMDRCGIERYLILVNKGGTPSAFTRHSPFGPLFGHYNRFHEGSARYDLAFGQQFFMDAQLLLMREKENTNLTAFGWRTLDQLYSDQPWECAKPFTQPKNHTIYFRVAPGKLPDRETLRKEAAR